MKRLIWFVLAMGVMLAPTRAVEKVDADAAQKAMEVFEKDPTTPEGFAAGDKVIAFARQSPNIKLNLSKAVVPWLNSDADTTDADTRHMLFIAYVVGNVRSQLKSGQAHDDVYAGWQEVLAVYDRLLRINSAAIVTEVESLKRRDKAGQLKAYAESVSR